MFVKVLVLLLLAEIIYARPQNQLPFYMNPDGSVGVNFMGFNAKAGLGTFITGNPKHGGLIAEAGTPFGQRAGAGLGESPDGGGSFDITRMGGKAQDGAGHNVKQGINGWTGWNLFNQGSG